MGFLDRFRPLPEYQHADPAVRVMAVQELPDEAQDLLGAIAREDTDAGIRRVAAGRLSHVETLATIAHRDQDEGVRAAAAAGLRHLALEGTDEAVAEAALASLEQPRDLADVAKTATFESVSLAALGRLTDARAIGTVARRADHSSVRLEALARIVDPSEVGGVALKSDHKDVALAALDKLWNTTVPADREALKAIAVRARNKAAARRAKAMLRPLDEGPGRPGLEEHRQQQLQLCITVESLARSGAPDLATRELAGAQRQWAERQAASGWPDDDDLTQRFVAACETLHASVVRDADARAEKERQARERADAVAARVAACEAVDGIDGDAALHLLAEARSAWVGLTPLEPEGAEGEAVPRRFEQACRDCERRFERWKARQAQQDRLEGIVRDAEQLVQSSDLAAINARWGPLQREMAQARGQATDVLQARFRQAASRLRARQAEERENRAAQQREHLSRLHQLCQELERAAQSEGSASEALKRGLRSVRTALENLGSLPTRRDREETTRRLRAVQVALQLRLLELRDIDDWRRWANLGVQETLCRRLEALRQVDAVPEVARQFRDIMTEWKRASEVPKDQSEALWRRFKAAHDEIQPRCDAYFARQAEERNNNLKRKVALCEEADALASSTGWLRTAERLTRLQAEWKTIGPAPRRHEQALWTRFRAACHQFFTRRKADLVRRKEEWARNLEHKEQLCAGAEGLAESTDWEAAVAEVRRLQAEWNTVGPVRRSRADVVWQRFRTACSGFLERYDQRDQAALAANLAERGALCRQLEELASGADAAARQAPEGLAGKVQGIRRDWRQAAELPRTEADVFTARFTSVMARLLEVYPESFRGTDLDPGTNLRKLEELCARVEGHLARAWVGDGASASPAEVLASRWREALAANTMGVRVDEEAKWREAAEVVKRAQAERNRLGLLPGEQGRKLSARFKRACDRFFAQRPGRTSPGPNRRVG